MPLYATQRNVQILVSLLKQYGIRDAVISPGSRNMPLVISLENDPQFDCHSVVDERSAVYYAVGMSTSLSAPVVLSCTSAQATRNYIPGMTEAYYRGTPLVVITADYKPSMIGQGVMQAIEQMSIPVDAAKVSVNLPVVTSDEDAIFCAKLVNEALLETFQHGSGPVHINIPVEEHWEGGTPNLPVARKISRTLTGGALPDLSHEKVLILVGQHAPFSDREERALNDFAEAYNAVVYTNHLSNFHGPRAMHASLLIENMDQRSFEQYKPDLLITIGGQNGDYGVTGRLRSARVEHWRVSQDGRLLDTFGSLRHVFEMSEVEFFEGYTAIAVRRRSTNFVDRWQTANARRSIPSELPLSHAAVAAELSRRLPSNSILHLAILSSLRNWNFFPLGPDVAVFSNVAAFGIDGCVSTFIGSSVVHDGLAFLIVGDLSFFYDMNVVGLRQIRANARIVLVNNGGGGEFRTYSHAADKFGPAANKHIAAAGHHGAAESWVRSMGWSYVAVREKTDLAGALDLLVAQSDRPVFVEVFTTMQDDSDGVRIVREANTIESLERRIAKHLSPEMKRAAKFVLGRRR